MGSAVGLGYSCGSSFWRNGWCWLSSARLALAPCKVDSDIQDPVFLSGYGLASPEFDEQFTWVEAKLGGDVSSVEQERRVDPGIADRDGVAIGEGLIGHDRGDDVFGGIHELEDIEPGIDTEAVEHGGEEFRCGVAGAGAKAAETSVDLVGAGFSAARVLPMAKPRLLCAWKPTWIVSASLRALTRAKASCGSIAPAESTM